MADNKRRFGVHEVKSGPFKGGLHHATKRYSNFMGELVYFGDYLSRRLLPLEPEELQMQGLLLILQNLLEHELEILIEHIAKASNGKKEQKFNQSIRDGHVSFKTKYEWLRARNQIDPIAHSVLEEIRILRNAFAHIRPTERRRHFRYKGFPLLTQRSIRKILLDVELTLRKIRAGAGRSHRWMTVPPGYASEMGWSKTDVARLEGSKRSNS